ncbi:oligosaccharide flippase family protein [Clostridium perfringens]|uniref:oligosaccharide flippase family protein n=1 Tax=Clostridium perfringens TaxID=1502 RepID=UPI003B01EC70
MRSSIKSNYIFNLLNRIITIIIPLILTPYVTRVLGADQLGLYSYANTIASYFVMFSMMGISIYGSRAIVVAKHTSKKYFDEEYSSLRFIQFMNTIFLCLIYIVYLILFCKGNFIISFIQILYIISAMFDITWFMSGLENFKQIAIRNIIINIISAALIFLFVNNENDIVIYSLIKVGSILVSQIYLDITCSDKSKSFKPNKRKIKYHYKQLIILSLPVVAESIFNSMDRVMLGAMVSYSAVGLYYYSRMITDLPQCMVTSINTIMYPRITSMNNQGEYKSANKIFSLTFFMINALCIGLCFGVAAVSQNFVKVFLGPDYSKCAYYIPILAPYIVLAAWNGTIRYQYLLPNMQDKIYIRAIIIGILCNLTLNFVLIRYLSVVGSIIATIIAELVIAFVQTFPIRKEVLARQHIVENIHLSFLGLIMFMTIKVLELIFVSNTIINLIIKITVGGIVYIAILFIYIFLFKRDVLIYIKNR